MRIKNWKRFQHFDKRRPPWIKLYREILDQREMAELSDLAFRVLIQLWLLASEDKEMEGNLPDLETIAFRLRIKKDNLNKALSELSAFLCSDVINEISNGYQVDIKMISTRHQDVTSETEKEIKKEGEGDYISGSPPEVTEVSRDYKKEAGEVLEFLNKKTARRYDFISTNLDFIAGRLKEGASVQDCKSIIAMKCRKWLTDEKMKDYLRPATLFNKTKFAQYKGELIIIE